MSHLAIRKYVMFCNKVIFQWEKMNIANFTWEVLLLTYVILRINLFLVQIVLSKKGNMYILVNKHSQIIFSVLRENSQIALKPLPQTFLGEE